MPTSPSFSIAQLRQALEITEKIEVLQKQLASLMAGKAVGAVEPTAEATPATRSRRKMSAAARAKISAAQRARWAKTESTPEAPVAEARTEPAAKATRAKAPASAPKAAPTSKAAPAAASKPAPAAKSAPAAAPKKGGLTPEGRARLAEIMKARWAARKSGAAAPNASK